MRAEAVGRRFGVVDAALRRRGWLVWRHLVMVWCWACEGAGLVAVAVTVVVILAGGCEMGSLWLLGRMAEARLVGRRGHS